MAKPQKQKKPKTPAKVTQTPVIVKIPSVWGLLKRTWLEISVFWRPLGGVVLVYGLLYFVLVTGLSFTSAFHAQIDTSTSAASQATAAVVDALTKTYSGTQSDATVLVQALLFLLGVLAFVWMLRKLQALKATTVRDAYYQGPAQLIPVLLVSIVLLCTFLPLVIGGGALTVGVTAGGNSLEIILVGIGAALSLVGSLYLFAMFWPAFYVASLPETRPIQALKAARKLTKKRRLQIMRKLVGLALVVVLVLLLILFPIALIVAAATPYVAYLLLFLVFGFAQVYLYELYRSLL